MVELSYDFSNKGMCNSFLKLNNTFKLEHEDIMKLFKIDENAK